MLFVCNNISKRTICQLLWIYFQFFGNTILNFPGWAQEIEAGGADCNSAGGGLVPDGYRRDNPSIQRVTKRHHVPVRTENSSGDTSV